MSGIGQQYGNDAQPSPQPQMAPGALTQTYQGGVYPPGMGYLNPLAGLMTPQVTNNLANVGADLTSNPQEISGALARAQTTRDAATQDKASAITRAINVLQNMPNYDQQIAGAAESAGFGAPSRTGFSESFANANRGLQGALVGNREFDSQNAMQVAKLGLMKAGLPEDAAEATLGDIEKKFDLGAKFSQDAAMAQYRENLVNARNNSALLNYGAKTGMSPFGNTNGLSGVQPNDFATKIAGIENNTGNPAAQNHLSSAMGNGQFLTGTWLPLIKQVRPDLASKMSDDQLLALRADPQISQQMIVENAKQNAKILDSVGLPSNMTTLALAHRFGPQAAVSLLHAPNDAPMASLLGQDVLTANPTLAHQTVGQYVGGLQKQIGDADATLDENGNLSVATTGDDFLKSLPPIMANQVKMVARGEAPLPKGGQLNPRYANLLAMVKQYDPTFTVNQTTGQGISGREGVFFNRIIGAANAATASAKNIMEMPVTVNRGLFGGRQQGPGLMDALKEDLATAITPQDANDYNTMMAGVGRNLSAIEAAGLAPNGSLTHSMDSLVIKEGDTQETRMRKMAEMRQIIETGLEPSLANPRIPKEQKALVQKIISDIQTAVPFTQHDITAFNHSKNPQITMTDVIANNTGKQSGANPHSSAQAQAVRIGSDAEYDKLPSKAYFIGPDGHTRQKP